MKINYIDLFSGVGGFALGAYWAGFKAENHFYSEIDKYAVDLYKKRFPESIYLGDIKNIDCDKLKVKYPGEWVITGGFPCQDISTAGKGGGLDGARSGLWFEMWRIIRELRPKFVIAENVSAITSRGLDRVISGLAEIGYSAEWQCISAADVGAWHQRKRIWIIAYPNGSGLEGSRPKQQTKRMGGKDKVFHTNSENVQGRIAKQKSDRQSIGTTALQQSWWQQREKELLSTPKLCGASDGIPRRVDRTRCLGNAIVPQIAKILFEQVAGKRDL